MEEVPCLHAEYHRESHHVPCPLCAGASDHVLRQYFVDRCRANLHFLMVMEPEAAPLQRKVVAFPKLFSRLTINVVDEWDREARLHVSPRADWVLAGPPRWGPGRGALRLADAWQRGRLAGACCIPTRQGCTTRHPVGSTCMHRLRLQPGRYACMGTAGRPGALRQPRAW